MSNHNARVLFAGLASFFAAVFLVMLLELASIKVPALSHSTSVTINGTVWWFNQTYTLNLLAWSGTPAFFASGIFACLFAFLIPVKTRHCKQCLKAIESRRDAVRLVQRPRHWWSPVRYSYFCNMSHLAKWSQDYV
jgi:hypothetical protein